MTGDTCIGKVAHALEAVAGVSDVEISLSAGEATVQYDEHLASPDQMESAVKVAGYGVNGTNTVPSQKSKGGCCG